MIDWLANYLCLIPAYGWLAIALSCYILTICSLALIRSYTGRIRYAIPFFRLFLISMFLLVGLTELTYTLANILWYFSEGHLLLAGGVTALTSPTIGGPTPVGRLSSLSEIYHTVAGFIRPTTNAILVTTVYRLKLKDAYPWI